MSVESNAPIQVNVMSMPDEHYHRLRHEIEALHHPITITNPQGRTATFRISKGKLVASEETANGRVRYEVMTESSIRNRYGEPQTLSEKDKLKIILKRDKPSMSEEAIDYQADIIIEGRRTMMKLIESGVPADKAKQLVTHSLRMRTDEMREAIQSVAAERGVPIPDLSGAATE